MSDEQQDYPEPEPPPEPEQRPAQPARAERGPDAANEGKFNVIGRVSASRIVGDGGGLTAEQRKQLESQES